MNEINTRQLQQVNTERQISNIIKQTKQTLKKFNKEKQS